MGVDFSNKGSLELDFKLLKQGHFFNKFQILAAWSSAQKKHSTHFSEFSTMKGIENIKLGHVLSFYMHRKVFSQNKIQDNIRYEKIYWIFESPLPCI